MEPFRTGPVRLRDAAAAAAILLLAMVAGFAGAWMGNPPEVPPYRMALEAVDPALRAEVPRTRAAQMPLPVL